MKMIMQIILVTCCAHITSPAQQLGKMDLIGKYINHVRKGDTTSSYLFFSVDSFKLIYGIEVDDGKDFYSPMVEGSWTLNNGDVELIPNNGPGHKATFRNTAITISDKIDSIPILTIEGRTYIDIMKKVKQSAKSL